MFEAIIIFCKGLIFHSDVTSTQNAKGGYTREDINIIASECEDDLEFQNGRHFITHTFTIILLSDCLNLYVVS